MMLTFMMDTVNGVKRPLSKRPKIGFQDQFSLNAGQKYGEHSVILSTFIKLPFAIKIFALSIFDLPFYTGCIMHVTRSLFPESETTTNSLRQLLTNQQNELCDNDQPRHSPVHEDQSSFYNMSSKKYVAYCKYRTGAVVRLVNQSVQSSLDWVLRLELVVSSCGDGGCQAGLSPLRLHRSLCLFCQELAHIVPRVHVRSAVAHDNRLFDSISRGCEFEPHRKHCTVTLSKTLHPLLSTGSTQEDPSRRD